MNADTTADSYLQGTTRWETWNKLCYVAAIVGLTRLSSGVIVTITDATIARGEGQRHATSTWGKFLGL